MTRDARLVGTTLAAAVSLVLGHDAARPARAQTPVFRAAVNTVVVDVSVHERNRPVPGLAATDFAVEDNGVAQTVVDVSRESMPLDVTLVIDTSGSVKGGQLAALVRAVRRVAERLQPQDRATLITFNERVRQLVADAVGKAVVTASSGIAPGDQTSFRDALALALIPDRSLDRRGMLILMTDGYDTSSVISETALLETARRADRVVFVVGTISSTFTRIGVRELPPILDTLATMTGGRIEVLEQGDEVSGSFLRAVEDFRASYVLRYAVTGVALAGWHNIAVRVIKPGNYTVRARRGYFAR
jgi:VWFA-related protein